MAARVAPIATGPERDVPAGDWCRTGRSPCASRGMSHPQRGDYSWREYGRLCRKTAPYPLMVQTMRDVFVLHPAPVPLVLSREPAALSKLREQADRQAAAADRLVLSREPAVLWKAVLAAGRDVPWDAPSSIPVRRWMYSFG